MVLRILLGMLVSGGRVAMRWREMVQMLEISFTNMVHGFQQRRDQTPGPGCWSQSSDDVKIGFSDVEIAFVNITVAVLCSPGRRP